MNLGQLHYTSAPPGPDGSGFRFTAVTPGVPASVLREAEQLIGYEPPRGAPARPDTGELRLFPQAFTHTELSDGSRLLSRTVYTGADYSGRWGNFHAHAVHLPPGASLPGDALPVTAWDSPGWADRSPANPECGPLETLPRAGAFFDAAGLVAFAERRAWLLAEFFADLRAVCQDVSAPQIVLAEQDSADVARWLAVASTVLPRDAAERLTFTTYTRRPQQARQQIIGVLPDDVGTWGGHDHRYRLYAVDDGEGSGRPQGPEDRTTDVWARTAAAVWVAGSPGLFPRVRELPGGPFDPGPLATLALCQGVPLDAESRAAAAEWACSHPLSLSAEQRQRLTTEVTDGVRERLARAGDDLPGALRALEVSDVLGVGCADLLPDLARRAVRLALTDPESPSVPLVRTAWQRQPVLRAALLDKLDDQAIGEPEAVVRLLRRLEVVLPDSPVVPHVRMCAAMAVGRTSHVDRQQLLNTLLRASGVSHCADPLVLRTAVRLAWGDSVPSATEALLMLHESGAGAHRAAGTWRTLLRAAVDGSAHDREVPALAQALLREFTGELGPQDRGALLLREFVGELRDGSVQGSWTTRLIELRSLVGATGSGALEHAYSALARALLSPDRPESELAAMARHADPELIDAYREAARDDAVRDRLRVSVEYVADCFRIWSPQASGGGRNWDQARAELLDKVLRPVVRALPAEDVGRVEVALERTPGGPGAAEFRTWNRPGKLGRFAQRLGGRKHRAAGPASAEPLRRGDIAPREEGEPS